MRAVASGFFRFPNAFQMGGGLEGVFGNRVLSRIYSWKPGRKTRVSVNVPRRCGFPKIIIGTLFGNRDCPLFPLPSRIPPLLRRGDIWKAGMGREKQGMKKEKF